MDFLQQHFNRNEIEVEFAKDSHFFVETPPLGGKKVIPVVVYVRKEQRIFSLYSRTFPNTMTRVHYMNFVKKFLEIPDYRKAYIKEGYPHWEGKMECFTSPSIHPSCKEEIERMNAKESVKFNEIITLKTYGKDRYSSMKIDTLKTLISEKDYLFIKKENENEGVILSALRWIARGLISKHALYKARTEAEILRNKRTQ